LRGIQRLLHGFSYSPSRGVGADRLIAWHALSGRKDLHEKPDVQATSEDIALSLGASVLLEPSRDRRAVSLVGLGGIPSAGRVPRELDRARTPDSKVRV
jgi:hypothetical protein